MAQFVADTFIKQVQQNNPHQPEFIQAVKEVMTSLEDFLQDEPNYIAGNLLTRLVEPERVIQFRVPWVNDQGEVEVSKGYRVQFNSALGPHKGGLRFHPTVNLSILKFLAFEQIFKNALTGLPLGGGKGGSDFDPKGRSDGEIMRFTQSFATELSKHIGDKTDVPAGDIGVGPREIGYIFGQYKKLRNEFTGVLTGKGLEYGGSLVRTQATGYGVVYLLQQVIEYHHDSLAGKTILVSGSGNVAIYTAEKLIELGAKPVTMSDSQGTIYVESGINQELLAELKQLKFEKRGRLAELAEKPEVIYEEGVTPWQYEADVAIPAATQNEIAQADAEKLVSSGVKYVAEGANMPTTTEGYQVLHENNVVFIPGKAANAGGVAVSGLEMSQNSQRLSWDFVEVDQQLQKIMKNIHNSIVEQGKTETDIDYVKGANIAGFIKVAKAMHAQGIV